MYHILIVGIGFEVRTVYILRWFMEMDGGYDSSDSTYYSAHSSDSEWGDERHSLETSFLTALPRDVIEFSVWPLLMDGCNQCNDLVETLCTLRSVCTGWRNWIRETSEGTMYIEAYSNHLIDLYVLEEMEEVQLNTT